MEVNILQKSMLQIIGDDIKRKPIMEQWYKKPDWARTQKDGSAILLEDK